MPLSLKLYQVDAFAEGVFSGNPAAVVPLEEWLPDATLAAIAAENNLSETAFLVPLPGDADADYHLRWFTPTFEIDLCGHATLGASWVVFHELFFPGERVRFRSMSGPLAVEREGDLLVMDFPSWPPKPVPITETMCRAFGARPLEAHAGRDLLCIFADEDMIRGMQPDLAAFHEMPYVTNIASAQGKAGGPYDFVSRVFCPEVGIPEDPVTGSAHSLLIPFWAGRLGKTTFNAYQASKRGGRLFCELRGERVRIAGRAAPYLRGVITI
jgi:PhzF family phenazine biosynthesis protein